MMYDNMYEMCIYNDNERVKICKVLDNKGIRVYGKCEDFVGVKFSWWVREEDLGRVMRVMKEYDVEGRRIVYRDEEVDWGHYGIGSEMFE